MSRLCVMMVGDSSHAVRKHDKFTTLVSSAKNNQLVLLFFGFPYESSVVFNLYTVLYKCRVVMTDVNIQYIHYQKQDVCTKLFKSWWFNK